MQEFTIRRALSGDEETLANVHVQAWQEAYKGLVPQAYLDALPSELTERTENWKRSLVNAKRWIWVATVSDKIVGFTIFGLPRDENRETFIELGAIYLLEKYKNKGIGFALLSAGFKLMSEQGYQKAYCWVLENNPTIRFYERSGATFSGQKKPDEIGGKSFNELAYEWDSLKL
ncbi:N-acetyltransferase family protein [Bdellovibrio sp. HCB337]|uniref:GNAT family N-acetyltransferase n=1 Tax=Bdellovibrio sp. HCB337 TaxID=3394358 RepID=UPI0039A575BB